MAGLMLTCAAFLSSVLNGLPLSLIDYSLEQYH